MEGNRKIMGKNIQKYTKIRRIYEYPSGICRFIFAKEV
jgi:hypothetical protein